MTTLRDLSGWIEHTLGGDAPRVNSLVKLVRGEGLFSSGGRGRNAPSMRPSDFATAIACSLTTAVPTKAAAEVQAILGLKRAKISIDYCDGYGFVGHDHGDEMHGSADVDLFRDNERPPELPTFPLTLRGVLEMWTEHFMEHSSDGVSLYDKIVLRTEPSKQVMMQICNPSWSRWKYAIPNTNSQTYAWTLKFEPGDRYYSHTGREVQTKLDGMALQALAKMAGDNAPS